MIQTELSMTTHWNLCCFRTSGDIPVHAGGVLIRRFEIVIPVGGVGKAAKQAKSEQGGDSPWRPSVRPSLVSGKFRFVVMPQKFEMF